MYQLIRSIYPNKILLKDRSQSALRSKVGKSLQNLISKELNEIKSTSPLQMKPENAQKIDSVTFDDMPSCKDVWGDERALLIIF